MDKNNLIKVLNLDENDIEEINEEIENNDHKISIKFKQRKCLCPRCKSNLIKNKGYKWRTIKAKVLSNFVTTIKVNQRIYKCLNCKHVFNQENKLFDKNTRITNETIENILEQLKYQCTTYESVARHFNISTTEVLKIFDKHINYERKKLPEIMCVDECHNKRQFEESYSVVLCDFCKKDVTDVFLNRQLHSLRKYFSNIPQEERLNVHIVSMDMHENYKTVVKEFLPNAIISIDPFHVIKNIKETIKKIESNVLKTLDDKPYQKAILKKYFDDIIKYKTNHQKIVIEPTYGNKLSFDEVKEIIYSIDYKLRIALIFLEDYLILNKTCTRENFKEKFLKMIRINPIFKMDCFKQVRIMFKNWFPEIENSFIRIDGRRISNGLIEGFNSTYKKIMKVSNGVNNFKRFRNRLFHCVNGKKK